MKVYPKLNQKVKCIITWGKSKLNGIPIGYPIGKPFRVRSGAVLHRFKCETCGYEHCIPWTSNKSIIKFEVLEN